MSRVFFQFKQFLIKQDIVSMKVGTDSVLLGAKVNIPTFIAAEKVLDIGTGSGILALMLAQRIPLIQIDAIDIDISAYLQAYHNFKQSNWNDRLNVYCISLQEFELNNANTYKLIICNPPYFSNGLHPILYSRKIARHDNELSLEVLVEKVNKLLTINGHFAVILPVESENRIIELCLKHNLFLSQKTLVRPSRLKPVKRIIFEFSKTSGNTIVSELAIEKQKRHDYTIDYINLTSPFYLNF